MKNLTFKLHWLNICNRSSNIETESYKHDQEMKNYFRLENKRYSGKIFYSRGEKYIKAYTMYAKTFLQRHCLATSEFRAFPKEETSNVLLISSSSSQTTYIDKRNCGLCLRPIPPLCANFSENQRTLLLPFLTHANMAATASWLQSTRNGIRVQS